MSANRKVTYFITPFKCVLRKTEEGDDVKYEAYNYKLEDWQEKADMWYYFSGYEDGRFATENEAMKYIKDQSNRQ